MQNEIHRLLEIPVSGGRKHFPVKNLVAEHVAGVREKGFWRGNWKDRPL
jgi:hypothetical protein